MRAVVITTIHRPTTAIRRWSKIGDRLIVVGDRKTPSDWSIDGATFLPSAAQRGALADVLPWNHYCRKNLGYVEAIRAGADTIVDTDDDNIPKEDWYVPPFDAAYETVDGSPFVNVYKLFNPAPDDAIWPRGYPLDQIRAPTPHKGSAKDVRIGVWQGLADGDPDVDAIYRMTRTGGDTRFRRTNPLALEQGAACPFNSQNTVFRREVFQLLYLPVVEFRFTDILRSIVAQPVLWAAGYRLGFTGATVVQERNQHNLMDDFKSEVPMYLHAESASRAVAEAVRDNRSVTANMRAAYEALATESIIDTSELHRVDTWLRAICT